jgi:hypothetical protein
VNGELFTGTSANYQAYVGEPLELEMKYHTNKLAWNGSLVGKLEAVQGSSKKFKLTVPIALGQNAYTFGATSTYSAVAKMITESHLISLSINGNPKPKLARVIGEDGRAAAILVRGKSYKLDLTGTIKPIRKITLDVNGLPTALFWRNGAYWFIAPQPKGTDILTVGIDGVKCDDLKITNFSAFVWTTGIGLN